MPSEVSMDQSTADNNEGEHSTLTNQSISGLNKKYLSLIFFLTYLLVLGSVVEVQMSPKDSIGDVSKIPLKYSEAYTRDAWLDLQVISSTPHSYGNRANDDVRAYIIKSIQHAQTNSTIDIDIDTGLQHLFFSEDSKHPIYYESNNVLVKVSGSHPNLSNILVSAHYDSVPTGKGTTDDGMGIASMLGILRYMLAQNEPPTRTVIFNFNNNEEFGLLGARAFLSHEWSKNIGAFLNLEGAGAGGRPVLFRATDLGMAQQFASASNPHGSSLLQQGFESRMVSSDTDYTIYVSEGKMRGLDLAFYKPRALYHSRRDNIQSSSLRSLGLMFTNALDITNSLSSYTKQDFPSSSKKAVYFDLFGQVFFVFQLGTFFWLNLLGLIVGPVLVWYSGGQPQTSRRFKRTYFHAGLALLVAVLVTSFYLYALEKSNPFLLVSSFYVPLFTSGMLFLVTSWLIVHVMNRIQPSVSLKLDMYVVIWAILWVLLLLSTISIKRSEAIGTFLVTYLYYGALVGIAISTLSPRAVVRDRLNHEEPVEANHDEAHERTRLLPHASSRRDIRNNTTTNDSFAPSAILINILWVIEFAIVVPITLIITSTTAFLAIDAMHQTLNDSVTKSSVFWLFQSVAISAVALFLFASPISHVFHRYLIIGLTVAVILGSLFNFTAPPYTYNNPLKLRFKQLVDVDNNSSSVVLLGTNEGAMRSIIRDLPSFKETDGSYRCIQGSAQTTCEFIGLEPSVGGSTDFASWIHYNTSADVERVSWGLTKSSITVWANNTRTCNVAFYDENGRVSDAVKAVTVVHDNNESVTARYGNGYESVQLHKLHWQDPYVVNLEWLPSWQEEGRRLMAEFTCMYAEYDTVVLSPDGTPRRGIPALDEVLEYSPDWVSWVNSGPGLVQAKFVINL